MACTNVYFPAYDCYLGILAIGHIGDDLHGFIKLGSTDYPSVLLDYARFLGSDLGERIAQHFHMIHADGRYYGYQRSNYVRGIKPSAEAHFKNGILYAALLEIEERDCRSK